MAYTTFVLKFERMSHKISCFSLFSMLESVVLLHSLKTCVTCGCYTIIIHFRKLLNSCRFQWVFAVQILLAAYVLMVICFSGSSAPPRSEPAVNTSTTSSSDSALWICSYCTFLNQPQVIMCEMCSLPHWKRSLKD